MTNTTPIYWSADGVSLQTFTQNIETMAGRLLPAPMVGDDIVIPGQQGETWVPKIEGARVLTLSMWVLGGTPSGDAPPSGSSALQAFDANWRALRNLLWTPGRQFALTKQFYLAGSIKSVTAMAEFAGGLEPTMIGRNGAKFTVNLKIAKAYFFDDAYTTFSLVTGANTCHLDGDGLSNNLFLTINGTNTNALIVNNTAGMQVQYYDALLTGGKAELDIFNYACKTTPSGVAPYDSTGKVRHAGALPWLQLKPGDNTLTVSRSAGTGSIQLQGKGAWL